MDRIHILIDTVNITEKTVDIFDQIPSTVPIVIKGFIHDEFIKNNLKNLLSRRNVLYTNLYAKIFGLDAETLKLIIETNSMYDMNSNECKLPSDIVEKYPELIKELQAKAENQSMDNTNNTESTDIEKKKNEKLLREDLD